LQAIHQFDEGPVLIDKILYNIKMENIKIKEDIVKIIKAGTLAPSGDNVQPWRFVVSGNTIKLFNIYEKDNSLYNFKQNASIIAHGAVIENMIITAKEFGYNVNISLFPNIDNNNHIANIKFVKENTGKDFLFRSIEKRATNRKPYKKIQLTDEQRQAIFDCNQELPLGKVILAEGDEKVRKLGKLLSVNEQIVLENKNLHDFLFEHIVWNEKEKREKKSGLYIKTLELGGPQKIIFKLVKNFTILKFLNKFIKISKKVAKKNAEIYASSSAIVAISVNEDKNKDYVNTGRMMQRLWLTATHLGLSAHPSTGVILLAQRIHAGDAFKLSNNHVSIIEKAYAEIKNIFGIENDTIKMILRIGDGGKPSAYSSRLEPEIIFE